IGKAHPPERYAILPERGRPDSSRVLPLRRASAGESASCRLPPSPTSSAIDDADDDGTEFAQQSCQHGCPMSTIITPDEAFANYGVCTVQQFPDLDAFK